MKTYALTGHGYGSAFSDLRTASWAWRNAARASSRAAIAILCSCLACRHWIAKAVLLSSSKSPSTEEVVTATIFQNRLDARSFSIRKSLSVSVVTDSDLSYLLPHNTRHSGQRCRPGRSCSFAGSKDPSVPKYGGLMVVSDRFILRTKGKWFVAPPPKCAGNSRSHKFWFDLIPRLDERGTNPFAEGA